MGDFVRQLFSDDAADVRASLAAGADPNSHVAVHFGGWGPLDYAAHHGNTECVAALIAGGADVNFCNQLGYTALMCAAKWNRADCVQLLLAAGADPLAVTPQHSLYGHEHLYTALHYAAANVECQVAPLLLQAAPSAALARGWLFKVTPLTLAIRLNHDATARCLLEQGPLPPAVEVLSALAGKGAWAWPIYATLAGRQPLTAEDWGWVPTPTAGLGAALPAVLGRSEEEAGLLVRHLPANDRQRLRTAALCLVRVQNLFGCWLPTPELRRILALSAA